MTFQFRGRASTTEMEDSWTIRNVYDFGCSLGDSSEMLVVRPEKDEFALPTRQICAGGEGPSVRFHRCWAHCGSRSMPRKSRCGEWHFLFRMRPSK